MIIFFWRGLGLLTVPIIALTAAITGGVLGWLLVALTTGVDSKNDFVASIVFLIATISLIAGAAANWFIGRRLNGGEGRVLVDPKTGEEVVLRSRHDFFFVKMEYWSIPVVLVALFPLFLFFVGIYRGLVGVSGH